MELSRIEDWSILPGTFVHIRFQGEPFCTGIVDCITPDGEILWIYPHSCLRRIIEKALEYEVWAQVEDDGMLYRNAIGPRG